MPYGGVDREEMPPHPLSPEAGGRAGLDAIRAGELSLPSPAVVFLESGPNTLPG